MTTYNTKNPVPSADARDRYDNSQVFDELMNGPAPRTPDRLGILRQSWAGIEAEFVGSQTTRAAAFQAFLDAMGWSSLGAYAAGISIISHTQTVDYQGQPYQLKPSVPSSLDAPYVTTGNWDTEGVNFKLVGDNSLRQYLLSDQGSQNIGTPRGTVEADVLSLREKNDIQDGNLAAAVTDLTRIAETGVFGKDVMFKKVRARTKVGTPFIHVFGDSISHGAFADDWYRNGWVNVFKRMLNVELGTQSYGVTPMQVFNNPVTGTLNNDVHDITVSNGWTLQDVAHDCPTGSSWLTSAAGAELNISVPTFQARGVIYYAAKPGGGAFDILVNGVTIATVDTSASARNAFVGSGFLLTDNGLGKCNIKIRTKSMAPVEITGIGYYGQDNQAVLQNFSESGRKLRNTSEGLVSRMMSESALFIMALGVNDYYDHRDNPAAYAEFVQVIDWLIQYANLHQVPVVVPDFVWFVGPETPTRMQLKRLADETNGTYIPFPDHFKNDGTMADADYLINTLYLFTNDLHPNIAGHKYIAEVVAKRIGLSISSKQEVMDYHDWWYPLELNPALGAKNSSTHTALVSAVKNQGGQILVRLNIKDLPTAGGGIALGFPYRAGVRFDIPVTTFLTPTNAGVSRGVCIFNQAGVSVLPNASNDSPSHQLHFAVPRTS